MFDSTKKSQKRSSILKNSNRGMTTTKKQQSTALGNSVKFKQQKENNQKDYESPKQFIQNTTEKKPIIANNEQLMRQKVKLATQEQTYDKFNFIKDINLLNGTHSHVLMMLGSHFKMENNLGGRKVSAKQQNLIRLIQKELAESIEIKVELDAKKQQNSNIFQISHYLRVSHQSFGERECQAFLQKFKQRERQIEILQRHLGQLRYQKQNNRGKFKKNESQRQKQQNIKMLMKKLQKQNVKIQMLESQQRKLLKKLYKTQKDVLKNEKSNSALKLKINQLEGEEEYRRIRAKTRIESVDCKKNKQNNANINMNGDRDKINGNGNVLVKKNMKIESVQKLKGSASLNKLIKKRML